MLLIRGHRIPPRKMDGLLANMLLLQVLAYRLPPFPPSCLSPSTFQALSSNAVQEALHEAPWVAQALMFPQPQCPRSSKQERGALGRGSTVF